jgi:phosphoserine phosphatase
MNETPTLLITLTGKDRPGVTAATFDALGRFRVEVLDIEQIVLRGRLVLGILVTAPPSSRDQARVVLAIEEAAASLGMDVEIDTGEGDNARRSEGRVHVTVLGHPLAPRAVAAITGRIADTGANIDRIVRMARYPVTAIEFDVSGTHVGRLRELLAREAVTQGIDVAVQTVGLLRHGRRLIVMDVDSTLVQGESIDMLADRAGVGDAVAKITERAMRGEIDFEESLRGRVALLAGLDASALDEVCDNLVLAPGARTLVRTLRRLGYRFAVVSGGFSQMTDRLARELKIDYARANELEVVEGKLTGRILGTVVDRAGKAAALRDFAADSKISLDRTVAVGDGANDLDMLTAAGLGIAFNAKPAVKEIAHASVNVPYLDTILYLLGISREDIEAADAKDGITTPAPPVV